ncbi:MAG: nitrite/sulfite reductase, partial [Acidobacteria bacterium]|nr:nitrite/sulfite reductase [Acidobacteriota bacterium]
MLRRYECGEISADDWRRFRLLRGTYGQRQDGVQMLRIKIPQGILTGDQLRALGRVAARYSRGFGHITTRQNMQFHFVLLQDAERAMRELGDVGLTTREACGNTIRNVTACPLAGVCPREHVDVTRHLDGAVAHFLRNPLNQQLPRKFKISFSGCEADCAQGLMHDMGIVAVRNGTRFGFKVLAGGGLGHK